MTADLNVSPEHLRLIAKLESIGHLTPEERKAVSRLPLRSAQLAEGADVLREGDKPSACCILVEGFLCRYKILPGGGRQIMSIHTSGDIPDLHSLHLQPMDHSLGTLTQCRVAFVAHRDLQEITLAHAGIASLLWRDTLIDAAIFREWLTGVGRRTAYQRIAHLFCEIHTRLKAVGLANGGGFDLPVTQGEIADCLGLTSVHVNRVLQELRHDGLIQSHGRFLGVSDWSALEAAGDFDPGYLHVK